MWASVLQLLFHRNQSLISLLPLNAQYCGEAKTLEANKAHTVFWPPWSSQLNVFKRLYLANTSNTKHFVLHDSIFVTFLKA
jgi:hypothetical protein